MLDNDEVEIKELIGEGGMAKVFREHGEKLTFAIKKHESSTSKQAIQMAKLMEAEIEIQQNLSHVNILPMFGYTKKGKEVLLVSELMDMSLDAVLYPDAGPCPLTAPTQHFISKEMCQ